ncbi:uncharacterized protein LOC132275059 [Cornus florida]|uniref:uncharacterized protein LOC132275059 n=1 Tax=Cornus florida TaxID=4283 RepID=UPI00289923CA|nr:uncharacterized protein LOC132275059 [Cornus florida]
MKMEEHEEPSSPGVSPVQVKECIEEVLNFTLASSIDENLGIDIGLSKEYCSNLLKNDPAHPNCNHTVLMLLVCGTCYARGKRRSIIEFLNILLCKPLASALYQSISSGSFCRTYKEMELIHEDSSMKQKEEEWNQLVLAKGSELVNVLKAIDFELHAKSVSTDFLAVHLYFLHMHFCTHSFNSLQDVIRYASFSEMLEAESLTKVLPGVKTTEEGVRIYQKFYTEEKERSNGVLAIHVTKPAAQLYISLASILLGLSYEGVQRLLGLTGTAGTIPEALPPPRSTLLLSFLLPHNPEVKGCILSDGARALAKHINRSSVGYWGSLSGSGWFLLF